ncbi:MAG: glycosyltransferase [Leptolyngbya sp. SIO1D8]|nr:glycosyltransferase [Leptolyngbya sp. SIO1D8]
MIETIFSRKVIRFLLGGGFAAAFNLFLIFLLVEFLGFNSSILRNVANILSMECSLIASFFIYRIWVWPGGSWKIKSLLFKQLPLYHLSAGLAISLRIFVIFPFLDWLGINYLINTVLGVFVSAGINYVLSDSLVFQDADSRDRGLYPPEGLGHIVESIELPGHKKHSVNRELLSLVIPAHNEEGCIAATVNAISATLTQASIHYEILVVNDNSRDSTETILQGLSRSDNCVHYINNYYPNGFGFAVRCGLENFSGDAVAIVMADSSDSPEDIVRYYYKLQEGYDCVLGSRFIKGGRVSDYPTHKLIVNRLANLFIQIVFGLGFNDVTNAFKIYRREVIEGIMPLISHHFNLTVEIPLKAIIRGYSYSTIPITWRNRQTGVSKLKIKEMGSRYLFIVLYLWLEKHLSRGDYHRRNHRNNMRQRVKING